MKNFSVIVGNIGNVHNGNNGGAAKIVYNDYVRQSKGGAGRMSNEPVILLCDDELIKEYSPGEKPIIHGLGATRSRQKLEWEL